jgi:hypothetical protein
MSELVPNKAVCDVGLHGVTGANAIRVMGFYDPGGYEADTGETRQRGIYFEARCGNLFMESGVSGFDYTGATGIVALVKPVEGICDGLIDKVIAENHNDVIAELLVDLLPCLRTGDNVLYTSDNGMGIGFYDAGSSEMLDAIRIRLNSNKPFSVGLRYTTT